MNFTREPIIETIISAKDGYKLKIKSTKSDTMQEYLVDAVQVVSFGTTFFYRSGEPAHTFFVPAQDFEIIQVRQARLMLKTPIDKAVKIAGGADAGKKGPLAKSKDRRKQKDTKETAVKSDEKKTIQGKSEEKRDGNLPPKASTPAKDGENAKGGPKAKLDKPSKRPARAPRKTSSRSRAPAADATTPAGEQVQPSMFSHLLRPPEALISDNIHKYKDIIDEQVVNKNKKEIVTAPKDIDTKEKTSDANVIKSADEALKVSMDDPNITSEAPKPFEKLEEKGEEERPLTLKEKMKKVLSPAVKDPSDKV